MKLVREGNWTQEFQGNSNIHVEEFPNQPEDVVKHNAFVVESSNTQLEYCRCLTGKEPSPSLSESVYAEYIC